MRSGSFASASRQRRTLQAWCSLDGVKAAVAVEYGCGEQALLRRHSRGDASRQVLLYLAATCCRGRYRLSGLGQELGLITVGALSRARGLMAGRIAASQVLKAQVSSIEARLKAIKCNNQY